MTAERACWRELAQLVADHVLTYEHRDVFAAVVDRQRVSDHGWDDHGATRPRLNDGVRALFILRLDLDQQVLVNEGALLQTTWHLLTLPWLLS